MALAVGRSTRVRGMFVALLGAVSIGLGAGLYYGDLDMGSLTRNGTAQPVGNSLAYIPIGIGAVLLVVGLSITVMDRLRR